MACVSIYLGVFLENIYLVNVFANLLLHLQVVPAWLNCLPIKGDLIEAKVVHDQLCSMAERLAAQTPLSLLMCAVCFFHIVLALIFLI